MATSQQTEQTGVGTTLGTSTAKTGRDLRSARRFVAACCLVLAPLAVAVVRGTFPGAGDIAGFVAYPGMARIELTADIFASLTWPFAIMGLYRLLARHAPILAVLGAAVALVGWTMLPAVATIDGLTAVLAQQGGASAPNVTLLNAVSANATVSVLFGLFVLGHELGTLLLGLALARSRIVPVWAGVAVMVGIILHPVAIFLLHLRLLDAASFVLIAIGFTVAARVVLATPNDAWDLPPLTTPGR
jgi:hypothetical protein